MITKKFVSWFFILLLLSGMIFIFSPGVVATDSYFLDFDDYITGDQVSESWVVSGAEGSQAVSGTYSKSGSYSYNLGQTGEGYTFFNVTNTDFESLAICYKMYEAEAGIERYNRHFFYNETGTNLFYYDVRKTYHANPSSTVFSINVNDGGGAREVYNRGVHEFVVGKAEWVKVVLTKTANNLANLSAYYEDNAYMVGTTMTMSSYWSLWNGSIQIGSGYAFYIDDLGYNGGVGGVGTADGNITINVYNESDPSVAIPDWTLTVSDEYGGIYYSSGSNNNNPVTINHSVYGTGKRFFTLGANGYYNRTYYANIKNGIPYEIVAFLPPDNDANLYFIQVLDSMDTPIYNAQLLINGEINSTIQEVASGFTAGNGMYGVYLIPDSLYLINISKTGYTPKIMEECRPDPDYYGINYPIIFYLNLSSDEWDVDTFNNVILFCSESGWVSSNDTLHISFFDKLSETSDITIQVYESYNDTLSFNYSYSYTDTYDIDIWTSGLNTSRMHRITIVSMNHTTIGYVVSKSCDIYPIRGGNDSVNESDLEDAFRDVGGDFSMGYVNMFILFAPSICILVGLGKADPGFGVIVAGMYFILCSWHINLVDATTIAVLISILLPLGIIVIVGKRGKHIT